MRPEHPVQLVLTDDLRRSRLTVFFRLLLALPHFVWAALIGTAVAVGVFVNWFILLVKGQTPGGLHDFVAGYIRYVIHVEGYLFLAANPYPGFYPFDEGGYPIDVEIAPPERQNRWTTGFRVILAIPVLFMLGGLVGLGGGGRTNYFVPGGLAATAAVLIWFSALFRGRAPRGLRDVVAWGLAYSAQASAYLLLLTDRYPYSGPEMHLPPVDEDDLGEPHPVTLIVTDELRRSRLTVLFRLLLFLPHLVWLLLWSVLASLAAVAGWFAALAVGGLPGPLARFLSAYVRYAAHVSAFVNLVGNPFPGFVGKPGSYPIDVELVLADRQSRWTTGFRLLLAFPAFMLAGGAGSLLGVVAVLGWFSSLARGRMPQGLRNAGGYSVGYSAQTLAYALLVTDRYPDSTPLRLLRTSESRPSLD
jgi:hypothetical protein